MKFLVILSVLVFCSVFAANCPKNPIASCLVNHPNDLPTCIDLESGTFRVQDFKGACDEGGSTFVAAPCSKTDLFAKCAIPMSGVTGLTISIYGTNLTQVEALEYCSDAGGSICTDAP